MTDSLWNLVARLIVLFAALPVHECAHALTATWLGDPTPGKQGRLTLNPFAHLSLFGSLALLLLGFGFAKPVQVDPRNFKKPRLGMALTAVAGPLSNIIMALIALLLCKLANGLLPLYAPSISGLIDIFLFMCFINLQLAVFNLLPIPPLDGSRIFSLILPKRIYQSVIRYEQYIIIVVFILLWTGFLTTPIQYLTIKLYQFLDWVTFPISQLFR